MELSLVGRKIELLLAEKGMMNKELSEKSGMSPQSLSQIKKSKRLRPVTINKLSKAFKVPVEYFLT